MIQFKKLKTHAFNVTYRFYKDEFVVKDICQIY